MRVKCKMELTGRAASRFPALPKKPSGNQQCRGSGEFKLSFSVFDSLLIFCFCSSLCLAAPDDEDV